MRRGEDADIERLRLIAADRQHLIVFQNAQQLDLHRQRDVGQLIEEDRAAVGQGQQARPCLRGAGERPARVAEQLALDEVGVEGGHMHRQEGPIAPGTVAMNGAGDEFLARAAFSRDEDAGIARRHQRDALEHGLHRRGPADNLLRTGRVLGRRRRRLRRRSAQQGAIDRFHRLREIERFGQIIERSALDRPHRRRQIAERRHHDHRQFGRRDRRSRASAVKPSMPGRRTSRIIASGRCC